jgi:hypothetical protein
MVPLPDAVPVEGVEPNLPEVTPVMVLLGQPSKLEMVQQELLVWEVMLQYIVVLVELEEPVGTVAAVDAEVSPNRTVPMVVAVAEAVVILILNFVLK